MTIRLRTDTLDEMRAALRLVALRQGHPVTLVSLSGHAMTVTAKVVARVAAA